MADKVFGISLGGQQSKYLLVAVLAAILLAVILWPGEAPPVESGGAAAARQAAAKRLSSAAANKPAANPAAKTAGKKFRISRNAAATPEDELEATLKFNPFAVSETLQAQLPGNQPPVTDEKVQEELAEQARLLAAKQRLSEFKGRKVTVLLRTADGGSAALIGRRMVREGDIVDGVRILSISNTGIVVEAAPEP